MYRRSVTAVAYDLVLIELDGRQRSLFCRLCLMGFRKAVYCLHCESFRHLQLRCTIIFLHWWLLFLKLNSYPTLKMRKERLRYRTWQTLDLNPCLSHYPPYYMACWLLFSAGVSLSITSVVIGPVLVVLI